MYGLGGRRIGVTTLPPLGCVPLARTLFGHHEMGCVTKFNTDAQQFNQKLNSAATNLQKQYLDLKIVLFDIFTPLYDIIQSPSDHGKETYFFLSPFTSLIRTVLMVNRIYGRFCGSNKRVLWNRDSRGNLIVVQSKVNRNMSECHTVCVLG